MELVNNSAVATENTTTVNNTPIEAAKRKDLFMIDPRAIKVEDGFNCRVKFDIEDLVESIKRLGVLNPISVIKQTEEDGSTTYRLVDGERRYRAVMQAIEEGADIKRVPAMFLSKSLKKDELLIQQVARNEGKRFTEYEYAVACRKLKDLGYTNQQIKEALNIKTEGQVSYMFQLLELDESLQALLREDKISGSEIRRIIQNYKKANNGKYNEKAVVKQILNAETKVDEENKSRAKDKQKRITINDLDASARTKSVKETKEVKKGLTTLFEVYNRCTNNGEFEIELDIMDVLEKLNDGVLLDELFNNSVQAYKKAE